MYKISVKSHFSAAHHLRDYNGDCENMHGHNWNVEVTAGYESLQADGIAVDFRDLKRITDEVVDALDHKDLNQLDFLNGINPTSENIAKYIHDRIKDAGIPVLTTKVSETEFYSATYTEER